MKQPLYLNSGKPSQYFISCGIVVGTSLLCFFLDDIISYHGTALMLMLAVSIIASLYDIFPVLVACVLSGLILNFFFIPPLFTLHVRTPEDLLLLLIFFLIAVVNGVFTFRIRREERKTRERAARRNALKLYNTLFNSLSHELKTPIATVIGATEMLRDNENLSIATQKELLSQIDMAGNRLNRQVENLLSMSRLESGMLTLNKDWCDMQELLHTVAQQVKDPGHHTIIVEENENLPLFRLDIGLIQQGVYNIVQNALLYTPDGSLIKLKATASAEGCIITIADNGPGFPEEGISYLFDKFYRLPESKTGGTGLGLSISKGFVEAHGGNITAENITTGGAGFTLTIPAEANYLNKLKNE